MKDEVNTELSDEAKEDMLALLRDFLFSQVIRSGSVDFSHDPIEPVIGEITRHGFPHTITIRASTRKEEDAII